jgi:virginiamycin B lyase
MNVVWVLFFAMGSLMLPPASAAQSPETLEITAQIARSGYGMGYGFDSLWMVSEGNLVRVNPKDNSVLDIDLRSPENSLLDIDKYRGLAIGEGAVWVPDVGADTIYKVDPSTNQVVLRIPATLTGADGNIAAGFGSVWAVTAENANKTLTRFRSLEGSTEAQITLPSHSSGVVADFNVIWVASAGRDEIYRIDPNTNQVKDTIPLHAIPRVIVSGEGSIWALHLRDGTISRIDGTTGEVAPEIAAEAVDNDGDITVGGGFVWVTTRYLQTKIDPKNNSRVGSYKASPGTILGRRIQYGDNALWVSGGSIFRVAVP